MPKSKTSKRTIEAAEVSYFDMNQLELAYINRALKNPRRKAPDFVDISSKKRILEIQKRNLIDMCRSTDRERRGSSLESELRKILSGEKRLSLRCFMFR